MNKSQKAKYLSEYQNDLYWDKYYIDRAAEKNEVIGICNITSKYDSIKSFIINLMAEYEEFCENAFSNVYYPNELLTFDSSDHKDVEEGEIIENIEEVKNED